MAKKKNEDFRKDFHKTWSKLVAKAWSDDLFKQKLMSNPGKALQEAGLDFDPEYKFVVHEDTGKTVHLIIHQKPEGQLSEEELENVAGGSTCTGCSPGCGCR